MPTGATFAPVSHSKQLTDGNSHDIFTVQNGKQGDGSRIISTKAGSFGSFREAGGKATAVTNKVGRKNKEVSSCVPRSGGYKMRHETAAFGVKLSCGVKFVSLFGPVFREREQIC